MKLPPEHNSSVPNAATHTTADDITAATLDALFESDEQTYDQFLDNFTHLNTAPHMSNAAIRPVAIATRNGNHSNGAPSADVNRAEMEDDLEEETLEEGSTIPSVLSSLDVPATPNRVQLDNFVTNDSSDEDADSNGYVASFERTDDVDHSTIPAVTTHENESESEDSLLGRLDHGAGVRTLLPANADDQWPLNPGEVDEGLGETAQTTVGHVTKFRVPEVEYRMKTMEECIREAGEAQSSTDQVEPFHLDDDFDYENVALTPKFTEEERAYLTACKGTEGLG